MLLPFAVVFSLKLWWWISHKSTDAGNCRRHHAGL